MVMSARIWKFGDDIDTDVLAPGRYMTAPIATLAAHCLENVRPEFAASVKQGDIVAAGANFGAGSSREQAVEALKYLGVVAIVAKSFAGIFYRNAINLGLPVLECAEADLLADGSMASLDIGSGKLQIAGHAEPVECTPIPDFLMAIIADGGLVTHLEKRFAGETAS